MKHIGKVLTEQEVLNNRSNTYEFINFDETVKKAAEKYSYGGREGGHRKPFLEGIKWQQERSYSEEEVLTLLYRLTEHIGIKEKRTILSVSPKEWFEQFKKK